MLTPANYSKLNFIEKANLRKAYIVEQKRLCWYCKHNIHKPAPDFIMEKPINKKLFPENFFNSPIHLHHDHETGKTIGAVHCHCNAVLWQFEGK
jgi:hypothetical protein